MLHLLQAFVASRFRLQRSYERRLPANAVRSKEVVGSVASCCCTAQLVDKLHSWTQTAQQLSEYFECDTGTTEELLASLKFKV